MGQKVRMNFSVCLALLCDEEESVHSKAKNGLISQPFECIMVVLARCGQDSHGLTQHASMQLPHAYQAKSNYIYFEPMMLIFITGCIWSQLFPRTDCLNS
jgi:hypothetical protein